MTNTDPAAERSDPADTRADDDPPHTSRAEWVIAFLGAVMVLILLGHLLHQALTREPSPADLTVHADSIVAVRSGFLVALSVENHGGGTAAEVHVEGRLLRGDSILETSQALIDFVPVGGRRPAVLQFENDPVTDSLHLRVAGFSPP